jgi:hypothetical protein
MALKKGIEKDRDNGLPDIYTLFHHYNKVFQKTTGSGLMWA